MPDIAGGSDGGRASMPAYAMHDAAIMAVHGLMDAFGMELVWLVKQCKEGSLPYGSVAEAAALLLDCWND